jgi:N-acetylglucosaminyl-diphospho-decaprenol L-rhamnosyltransferase
MSVSAEKTAIVLTYNSASVISDCLNSLQEAAPSWPLLVVDNGSQDNTLELVESAYPAAEIMSNGSNLGYAAGYNRAIRAVAARGVTHAALINPDVMVGDGALDAMHDAFREMPAAAIAAPTIFTPAHKVESAGGLFSKVTGRPEYTRYSVASGPRMVETASGACMVVDTERFGTLDGFDERYFLYWEETDLCMRALNAKYDIAHVPGAAATHVKGTSSAGVMPSERAYYYVRGGLLFLDKHSGWRSEQHRKSFMQLQRQYHQKSNASNITETLAAIDRAEQDFAAGRFGRRQ